MDLVRLAGSQRALPGVGQQDRERSAILMEAPDKRDRRFGRGILVTASTGMQRVRTWATKFEMRSPRYTTRLGELPSVGADTMSTKVRVRAAERARPTSLGNVSPPPTCRMEAGVKVRGP